MTASAPHLTPEELEAIRREVGALNWFHRIPLREGLVTPGMDDTPEKIRLINLPADFSGKSVLDIGSWDGAIAFECERRGAARVLATDYFCWRNVQGSRTFQLARRVLGSRVEDLEIAVEDISPERVGMFDVVLFLGVLYHAPDPLGYLRRVRSVCREYALIETLVDAQDYRVPCWRFTRARR